MSQQPYQSQNYPQQYPTGHQVVYAVRPPTAGQAVAALVLGICSVFFMWIIVGGLVMGTVAVVFGHLAFKRIAQAQIAGAPLSGKGMAVAGLITGYAGIVAGVIHIAFYLWLAAAISSVSAN